MRKLRVTIKTAPVLIVSASKLKMSEPKKTSFEARKLVNGA